jgi:hypothetical protein
METHRPVTALMQATAEFLDHLPQVTGILFDDAASLLRARQLGRLIFFIHASRFVGRFHVSTVGTGPKTTIELNQEDDLFDAPPQTHDLDQSRRSTAPSSGANGKSAFHHRSDRHCDHHSQRGCARLRRVCHLGRTAGAMRSCKHGSMKIAAGLAPLFLAFPANRLDRRVLRLATPLTARCCGTARPSALTRSFQPHAEAGRTPSDRPPSDAQMNRIEYRLALPRRADRE